MWLEWLSQTLSAPARLPSTGRRSRDGARLGEAPAQPLPSEQPLDTPPPNPSGNPLTPSGLDRTRPQKLI